MAPIGWDTYEIKRQVICFLTTQHTMLTGAITAIHTPIWRREGCVVADRPVHWPLDEVLALLPGIDPLAHCFPCLLSPASKRSFLFHHPPCTATSEENFGECLPPWISSFSSLCSAGGHEFWGPEIFLYLKQLVSSWLHFTYTDVSKVLCYLYLISVDSMLGTFVIHFETCLSLSRLRFGYLGSIRPLWDGTVYLSKSTLLS